MARVNYGPPVQTTLGRTLNHRQDGLGPGMAVATTQRAAELAVSAINGGIYNR